MSSNVLEAMKNLRQNLHNVGSLNNWCKDVLNQGAKVADANIDNFELVELRFNADGERECISLTATANKGHLIATPEDYMQQYETISSFFNGVGEMARIVYLESGVRFECSNVDFHQKTGNAPHNDHPLKNGQVAHYDHATKKFIISNDNRGAGNEHGGYAGAGNKFYLVDKDCVSIDGQTVYRFEVQ